MRCRYCVNLRSVRRCPLPMHVVLILFACAIMAYALLPGRNGPNSPGDGSEEDNDGIN